MLAFSACLISSTPKFGFIRDHDHARCWLQDTVLIVGFDSRLDAALLSQIASVTTASADGCCRHRLKAGLALSKRRLATEEKIMYAAVH